MNDRPLPAAAWIATLALAAGVACFAVDGTWVYDDRPAVLASPVVQGEVALGVAVTRDFWGHRLGNRSKVSWRPALPLLWRGLWQTGGGSPLPLRALHPVGHVLATAALLALLLQLCTPGMALGAALLFAAHPAHADALGGVVGQADVFAAAFGFAALALLARLDRRRAAAAIALLAFGALFKESAVLYALAGAALVIARPEGDRHLRAWTVGGLAALSVAVAAIQAVAHGGHAEDATDNVLAALDPGPRVVTGLAILWRGLRVSALPWDVAANHGYASYSTDLGPVLVPATLGLLALIVGLWFGVRCLIDGRPLGALATALLFGPAVAQSHLLFVGPTEFAERVLYGGVAGACVGVVWLGRGLQRRTAVAAVAGLLCLALAGSWSATRPWRSPISLWQHAAKVEPLAWRVHHNLGDALAKSGQVESGLWHLMMGEWLKRRLPQPVDPRVLDALVSLPPKERLLVTPGALAKDDPCGLIEALIQVAWGRDATPDNARQARAAFAQRYPCVGKARPTRAPPGAHP